MAQYKVIQDIEAEDKLIGPLSLRQFIYAGIAAVLGYLSTISVTHNAGFLLVLFVPPMLFCLFFAWPWSSDQPTEVWALARIRFYFKPRKRIWDQSGMKDLVTITVPKKIQKVFTNNLSQTEVRSRLAALADTIDSRGWAVKNSNVSLQTLPAYDPSASDRLVANTTMPQPVSDLDIQADDDILDAQNNPVAHQFDEMIRASADAYRQKLMAQMQAPDAPTTPTPTAVTKQAAQPPADYWFMNQPPRPSESQITDPTNVMFANPALVQPGAIQPVGPVAATPTASEEDLAKQLLQQHNEEQQKQTTHLKTIQPVGAQSQVQAQPTPPAVTAQSDAAILNLASNNDLDVATLARQAQKARNPEPPEDEVVISLR
ncbi:hypothetical protein BH09PAT4_BH09PAT4_03310 [soil metagenome]